MVAIADDTTKQRRLEFEHRMPRHGHNVRPACRRSRKQDNRARLHERVDLGEREGLLCMGAAVRRRGGTRGL